MVTPKISTQSGVRITYVCVHINVKMAENYFHEKAWIPGFYKVNLDAVQFAAEELDEINS